MSLQDTYTLSNGVKIPKLGLGTWLISETDTEQAVKEAIRLGYRHIDTAQDYGNEAGVGAAMKASGVSRDELFVTTKLAAQYKSYEGAAEAIDASLERMGLDYIDMMIIHSPQPWGEFGGDERFFEGNRAWRALEEAYEAGRLHAIGLSNFTEQDIDNILSTCSVAPMVNQILAHVSNTPGALIEYSQARGMLVEAYSPMGHGELFKNDEIAQMADKYGVSVPQLCIRYTLQLGLLPLPKTANPAHMQNNADVDFEIAAEDMAVLEGMETIKDYGDASAFPVYQ
ncbi:diketogulonate reductase-like aldo/keto reductase [Kushneria sinocarnis]|uniref:Diketogulonate reductase-like aldo/keto reductase n=1 Tax=Kushneria sinocarnis TaxID=595502 RepID=A0A420X015_9GAMM|nr:aldo/keto reductase [Kushneria sinocarnis]RKR06892.1 diketogulonate reductase-like aldo/keto reductase [Kushneria sinocarnis]